MIHKIFILLFLGGCSSAIHVLPFSCFNSPSWSSKEMRYDAILKKRYEGFFAPWTTQKIDLEFILMESKFSCQDVDSLRLHIVRNKSGLKSLLLFYSDLSVEVLLKKQSFEKF